MIRKKKWKEDPECYFCKGPESTDHLLFICHIAKVIWGAIAICFHQKTRPSCYEQLWPWIVRALLGDDKVYMLDLVAICWAIWKERNRVCFEKFINNHFFSVCFYPILGMALSEKHIS
jgi:hypothetical protein